MRAGVHKSDVLPLKGKDIVIIGLQPWYYEIGSNCKNIAKYFSQHNRVLYVNYPINRRTYFSKKKSQGVKRHCEIIKDKLESINQVDNNIWEFHPTSILESINWISPTSIFQIFNYINNRRYAKDIAQAATTLGFKDIILFNDNDIINGFYLKRLLKLQLYIYYSRDFLQGFDYWKKHCTSIEPQLIKSADMVVANSTFLADYCASFNQNSYYIGQGCNLDLFNQQNIVAIDDIPFGTTPIIGYVGAIDSNRLDEGILETIALSKADWRIILVGPEDEVFKKSRLHDYENVFFLGRKPLDVLPSYINAFDVCINPQLKNEITEGNYPLKIDEYLAMGKPVVATKTATMKLFEDYTYLADNKDDFVELIEQAFLQNTEQKKMDRIGFANGHNWENTMQKLYGYMREHIDIF